MRSFLPIALLACAAAGARAQYPNLCPDQSSFSAWNQTRCPEGWSCAPNGFSVTGWGCAPFPNAVSCGAYQACPGGSTCQSISGSSYSQVGKPNTHGVAKLQLR